MNTKCLQGKETLESVAEMIRACIQCGTCSASCPNQFAMDLTPRQLWRLVLLDQSEAVFASRTFTLCSSCYYCTLRCPRGLPLTDAMAKLKQIAAQAAPERHRASVLFYHEVVHGIRRHGRINETALMTRYFIRMKNPLLPLRFAPLGVRLIAEGKLPLRWRPGRRGGLNALFQTVDKGETAS